MAVRVKTKWHRSRRSRKNIEGSSQPKSMDDLASVIAITVWRLAQQTYRHMSEEKFEFASPEQVTGLITEMIAFLIQVVDRTVYGKIDESDRQELINALARHLGRNMEANQAELLGPGDYLGPFFETLNSRFGEYAACPFDEQDGPGYAFKRVLGDRIAQIMAATDDKWVVEHVMEIEVPGPVKTLRRTVVDVLGLKKRPAG